MGQLVDVGAVRAELAPPDAQPVDDAGARARADRRPAQGAAAVVEDAHHLAARDAAAARIGLVNLDDRLAFDVAQALHVDEAGVQEVARRRRDHRERVAPRELGRARDRLVVRDEVGHAERGRGHDAAAVGRGEAAFGERRVGQRQLEPAGRAQRVEIEFGPERGARQRLVVLGEAGLGKTHLQSQLAEDLRVRLRLAERGDRRFVDQRPGVAVAGVHVQVLELRGRGQHVVGEVGGVGHEVFEHDREQVLAREAAHHLAGLRRHRDRVAVVDDQRLDLRAEGAAVGKSFVSLAQQVVADRAHVDRARQAPGEQVGPLQRGVVAHAPEPARTRQQQPAGTVPPRPHQAGQQRDQPHRVAAAARALHAVVQADRGGPGRAVIARQVAHLAGADAADLGHALGRPLQRAFAQRRPAGGIDMLGEVVVVEPVVDDQLVHQPERERAVGAGQQRDVPVALVGGLGLARVDADELRAGPLRGLREGPEVQVRRDRVAAPDQDQPALGIERQVHADLGAVGRGQRLAAGAGADRAVEQRRAEPVEEARRHALALHQPHRAGVAVGHDGLRRARSAGGDRLQPAGDVGQRLGPAHTHEPATAPGPAALHRMQHALGVVGALRVARDLGAQRAVRRRVPGVALDLDRAAVLHRDPDRAGVRAIMRAGRPNGRGVHGRTIAQGLLGRPARRGTRRRPRDPPGRPEAEAAVPGTKPHP